MSLNRIPRKYDVTYCTYPFQDGARYDNNGNRIKHPTASGGKKIPRNAIKHLLIPKKSLKHPSPPRKFQQVYPERLVNALFLFNIWHNFRTTICALGY